MASGDLESMPVGTIETVAAAARLLRSYEAHHREQAMRLSNQRDLPAYRADRIAKAERNAGMAEQLEALLPACRRPSGHGKVAMTAEQATRWDAAMREPYPPLDAGPASEHTGGLPTKESSR